MRSTLQVSDFNYISEQIPAHEIVLADMISRWANLDFNRIEGVNIRDASIMYAAIIPSLNAELDWPTLHKYRKFNQNRNQLGRAN